MAQADGVVANGTGSAVRSDINNQYAALWSNHSGSTEPSSGKVAFQTWADTNSGFLKIRNSANNAWIQLFKLDGTDICRLTGSTNNTVCTVTSANNIQGEANLTFDGNNLTQTIDADGEGVVLDASGNHKAMITGNTNRSTENNIIFGVSGKWNDTEVGRIAFEAGADTTNKDDGHINFYTTPSGGSLTSRLDIQADGDVKVVDGDLVIGTAGHGIDFSATSDAGGMTSELLDDYEEGTWEPVVSPTTNSFGSITMHADTGGSYTKIGNLVRAMGCARWTACTFGSASGNMRISLPFTGASRDDGDNADSLSITRCAVWNGSVDPRGVQVSQGSAQLKVFGGDLLNNTITVNGEMDSEGSLQFDVTYRV